MVYYFYHDLKIIVSCKNFKKLLFCGGEGGAQNKSLNEIYI
jgi:hypothetical protein